VTVGEPLRLDHLVFQAAIYRKDEIHPLRMVFLAPMLVINVDVLPEDKLPEDDFEWLIGGLLIDEQIEKLYSERDYYALYRQYGYESVRHDIRPLFGLRKVPTIFLFQH